MARQVGRQVLIAEEAPVIQNALYTLLASVESKRELALTTHKRLAAIAEKGCNSLILDLQAVDQPIAGTSPRVRNVRLDRQGRVAVVTCEIPASQIVDQINELGRPHFFPKHLAFSVRAFAYALSGLF